MSINRKVIGSRVTYFFLGEYFSDALRNTITVVLPILIFFILDYPNAATAIGLGTLLVSLTDLPDNKANKFKTAIGSTLFFFITALLIAISGDRLFLQSILLICFAFIFSMFSIFGNRISLIGMMSLILAVFVKGFKPVNPLDFSLYILTGCLWYYTVSLIQILIKPYRSLNHAIFECLMSSAMFLRSKGNNYNLSVPFDPDQKETIMLHIRVNQKHELIRNLLLTDKNALDPKNPKGRRFLNRTLLLIDLYEHLTKIHYDYLFIRKVLDCNSQLEIIADIIDLLAEKLEKLSTEFRSELQFSEETIFNEKMDLLNLAGQNATGVQREILSKIVINLRDIEDIINLIRKGELSSKMQTDIGNEPISYPLFITEKQFSIKNQFSLKSATFRFSIRLSCAFAAAFFLLSNLPPSKYDYWLLLTLVIVARPRFALTWKRNLQRLKGTLPGILFGLILISFIKNPAVLLTLSILFLLGFYAFNRLNYTISVLFITPAIVLTLGSYHGQFDHIIVDRLIYTILGCVISIIASYLLPIWERRQLRTKIIIAVKDSMDYLVVAVSKGQFGNLQNGRIARKNVNLSMSALSEAIECLNQEPLKNKSDFKLLYAIRVLIYQMNSLITTIYLSLERRPTADEISKIKNIRDGLKCLENTSAVEEINEGSNMEYQNLDAESSVGQKLDYLSFLLINFKRKFESFQQMQ